MDKRVIKTKRALFIALSELLSEKNIQDITVTDLTRQAGINRKTFYNHFSDVHDVLDDLEHQIVESLIEEFEANKQQGLYEDMFHTMYFLCRILEKDMKNWSGLLKYQGFYQDFLFKSQKLLKPVTINLLKNEFPNAEGDMIDLAVDYIMSGAVGVLARWLLNPDRYTSTEIAQILTRFMSGNCETLRNSCVNENKPKQR